MPTPSPSPLCPPSPVPLRARVRVRAFARLPDSFFTAGHDVRVAHRADAADGSSTHLVDVSLPHRDGYQALIAAQELASDLADRIAYLAASECNADLLSVAPQSVDALELFQFWVPYVSFQRSQVSIRPENIAALDNLSGHIRVALRDYAMAFLTPAQTIAYSQMWKCLEAIARADAKLHQHFRTRRCSECGHESPDGPDVRRHITKYFEIALSIQPDPPPANSVARRATDLRGKILHGGVATDGSAQSDVAELMNQLQAAACVALAESVQPPTLTDHCHSMATPAFGAELALDANRQIDESLSKPLAAIFQLGGVRIPANYSEAQPFFLRCGVLFPFPIDPIALPELRH